MSTAISDINTIREADAFESGEGDADLAFDSIPRAVRPSRAEARGVLSARRSSVDRRPPGNRPVDASALYGRGRVRTPALRRAQGSHPAEMVERAQVGLAVLAVSALLSALIMAALIGLAHWRAGTFDNRGSTTTPAVVEQQGVDRSAVPGLGG
ncbi:hypothetical protein [Nocardia australiensis]|uniref:hypothetical protein n=1 Tax=Nocardia australiensis TaxID=2887191 RepID=UPI001D1563DB|nr:hypothetical protein [Nocardia australiensis]